MISRVWIAYAAIGIAAVGLTTAAVDYWSAQWSVAIDAYRRQESFNASATASKASAAFAAIYENIRTIAMLPGLANVDRHASNLTPDTMGAIQQVYNNLVSNVAVSEVYILPADFDPEAIDPTTGHHETPIVAFDELIAGGTSVNTRSANSEVRLPPDRDFEGTPDDAGIPQIEIQEYRRLREQLQWMSSTYPTRDRIGGLNLPMIGSSELITCDNSQFDKTRNDADRMGLVQLVPFYGADGKLRGGVAAIMRSDSYRALLPSSDYSLVNTTYGYSSGSASPGQEAVSAKWSAAAKADPDLLYSEVLPIATADVTSSWQLWAGHSNSAFEASAAASGVRVGRLTSIVGIVALTLAGLAIVFVVNRGIQRSRKAERSLERRVEERTAEVKTLAAKAVEATETTARERRAMMASLRDAFGSVVGAARAGDLGRRVDAAFADPELNELARGVNELMETVSRGLMETSTVLESLARSDLTLRVTGEYHGAFARLKADTNAVSDSLQQIVTRLSDTSRGVRGAAREILAGANDLAERSMKQASAVQETSAAIDQLAATVKDNADRAQSASASSRFISEIAAETDVAMSEADQAMERIANSSEGISSIIGLIDDIAFQTNLLALNASVEAARAGESGRGFAVVAVEVRRLAQSAAAASADVKQLIDLSGLEVSAGKRLVEGVGQKLRSMVGRVKDNDRLMGEIAAATQGQSGSIAEMSGAIRLMDEMAQQNAALVEKTNATIEQTEQQIRNLDDIVSVFVIEREKSVLRVQADGVLRDARRLNSRGSTVLKAVVTH